VFRSDLPGELSPYAGFEYSDLDPQQRIRDGGGGRRASVPAAATTDTLRP
jgi:hypothetical protein